MKKRCFAILALLLAGCAADNVNVRESWGKSLAELGIIPLYPLRENVYIGDVLLYVQNPCKDSGTSKVPQTMLLGSLPQSLIERQFATFYGDRPQLPQTKAATPVPTTPSKPTQAGAAATEGKPLVNISINSAGGITSSTGTATDKAAPPQDSPTSDQIFRPAKKPFDFKRLPMAAFPSVVLSSYISASGGGAFHSISLALGFEAAQRTTVKANSVEVAELPGPAIAEMIDKFIYPDTDALKAPARKLFSERYIEPLVMATNSAIIESSKCEVTKEARPPLVIFIGGVYYTRSLEFDFGRSDAFAARLAASLPASAGPVPTFSPPSAPATPSGASSAQASAQALLTSLATMSGGPGAGGSIAIGSSGNLALNQTFARPMAFGLGSMQVCYWHKIMDALDGKLASLADACSTGPKSIALFDGQPETRPVQFAQATDQSLMSDYDPYEIAQTTKPKTVDPECAACTTYRCRAEKCPPGSQPGTGGPMIMAPPKTPAGDLMRSQQGGAMTIQ